MKTHVSMEDVYTFLSPPNSVGIVVSTKEVSAVLHQAVKPVEPSPLIIKLRLVWSPGLRHSVMSTQLAPICFQHRLSRGPLVAPWWAPWWPLVAPWRPLLACLSAFHTLSVTSRRRPGD